MPGYSLGDGIDHSISECIVSVNMKDVIMGIRATAREGRYI